MLLIILAFASINDIIDYKIPNGIIVIGWIMGGMFNLYYDGLQGIVNWMIGAVIPLIVFMILFIFKMLGAGDIKLFSVVGGFVGFALLGDVMFYTFITGGVLAFLKMLHQKNLKRRIQGLVYYSKQFFITHTITKYSGLDSCAKSDYMCFSPSIFLGTFIALYVM